MRAFILMPFDADFQKIYDRLIVPALEQAGFEVKRADSELDQQNVLKDVVRGIATADLVVADLTSRNANVLYELGLSHALGRNTVLLAQSIEEVPFDLRSYRIVRYSTEFDEVENLVSQLKEIGSRHAAGEIDFGSPITDFLPDKASADSDSAQASAPPAPTASSADGASEEGFLDAFVNFEAAGGEIKDGMVRIAASTEKIGNRAEAATQKMNSVQQAKSPGIIIQAHKIASEMGAALEEYAQELEDESPGVASAVETLINGGMAFTSWVTSQSEIDRDTAEHNRDQLHELGVATEAGLNGLQGFRGNLVELAPISSDMGRGSRRAIAALDDVTESLEQVQAFTDKAVGLLDERIGDA
jgi:hypothetical protein